MVPAPPLPPLRVAVATLVYPPDPRSQQAARCHARGCGVMAWCSAARRLLEALPPAWSTELLLLEAPPASSAEAAGHRDVCELNVHSAADCPAARRLRPSTALVAAVRAHPGYRQCFHRQLT